MNPQPHFHDSQLARMSPGMTGGADGWAMPMPQLPARRGGGGNGDDPQPLHKMHRLLRGRYKVAVTLSLALAGVCAAAGYMIPKPQYRSVGQIQIRPNIPKLEDATIVMPLYQQYVGSQVDLLQHPRMIAQAMMQGAWQEYRKGTGAEATKDFMDRLTIDYAPNSTLIRVAFTDPNPKRAAAAVNSVIDAYRNMYGDTDPQNLGGRENVANKMLTDAMTEWNTVDQGMRRVVSKYGRTDLNETITACVQEQYELRREFNQAWLQRDDLLVATGKTPSKEDPEQYLKSVEDSMSKQQAKAAAQGQVNGAAAAAAAKPGATKAPGGAAAAGEAPELPLNTAQLARLDPRVAQFLERYQAAVDNRDLMKSRLGPNHPAYQEAEARVTRTKRQLDDLVAEVRRDAVANKASAAAPELHPGAVLTPELLNQRIERLARMIVTSMQTAKAVGDDNVTIELAQKQLAALNEKIESAKRLKADIDAQQKLRQQIDYYYGDEPMVAAVDKRKSMAAMGFVGGGALPFLAFLLVGLSDKRFRYSDETKTDIGHVPLLGILPNLPDLLTDPQQAAVAAHCVHQIRTLLQVGIRTHDRHVYAITSAAPGDGKTSLTLALGLSFAASGSRTLLVDCDLVGGSLTRRLGVHSADGMLEAMASRTPLDFVQETDVNDLAILPVGSATMISAGSFSPAGLRRLIAEARKSYDIVLIDTGPILGSIEAPPVAATADATILCVSRGQQRPAVERSMHHLIAIGAKMAGIVFNRAEAKDFEKSVSRFSQRSIRPGQSGGGNGSLRLPSAAPKSEKSTNPDGAAAAATAAGATVDPVTRAMRSDFKGDNGNDSR